MPVAQIFGGAGVVQAEHRDEVPDRRQVTLHLRPDALRRRVGCREVRKIRLDVEELALQEIVFGVGDVGVAVDVVPLAVVPDLAPQLLGPRHRRLARPRPLRAPGCVLHGTDAVMKPP